MALSSEIIAGIYGLWASGKSWLTAKLSYLLIGPHSTELGKATDRLRMKPLLLVFDRGATVRLDVVDYPGVFHAAALGLFNLIDANASGMSIQARMYYELLNIWHSIVKGEFLNVHKILCEEDSLLASRVLNMPHETCNELKKVAESYLDATDRADAINRFLEIFAKREFSVALDDSKVKNVQPSCLADMWQDIVGYRVLPLMIITSYFMNLLAASSILFVLHPADISRWARRMEAAEYGPILRLISCLRGDVNIGAGNPGSIYSYNYDLLDRIRAALNTIYNASSYYREELNTRYPLSNRLAYIVFTGIDSIKSCRNVLIGRGHVGATGSEELKACIDDIVDKSGIRIIFSDSEQIARKIATLTNPFLNVRMDETPEAIVRELIEDGYVAIGDGNRASYFAFGYSFLTSVPMGYGAVGLSGKTCMDEIHEGRIGVSSFEDALGICMNRDEEVISDKFTFEALYLGASERLPAPSGVLFTRELSRRLFGSEEQYYF